MAKYSKKLVDKVVQMIEDDEFTVSDICKILGVSTKTYYKWRADKPEFAEVVAQAMENREERVRMMARQAMKKKLDGYKLVETKTEYALNKKDENEEPQLSVKEYVVKDKYCVPETSAINLALNGARGRNTKKMVEEVKPLSIVVSDEKVKRDLELLRNNLSERA